jgi:hypothetical protein
LLPTDAEHEANVKYFLDTARLADAEKHAVVCRKYPVKSRWQLEAISRVEIPVGLYPGKLLGDSSRAVASVTEATFAEHTLLRESA